MTTFLIIVGIIILIILVAQSPSKETVQTAKDQKTKFLKDYGLKSDGMFESDLVYVDGHPEVNYKHDGPIYFGDTNKTVSFYEIRSKTPFKYTRLFSIDKVNITSVSVEDASTLEKKVTIGRLLLVGVFALAWKKKKQHELAFLLITYSDGRFTHDVIFQADGSNAKSRCLIIKNKIMAWCY